MFDSNLYAISYLSLSLPFQYNVMGVGNRYDCSNTNEKSSFLFKPRISVFYVSRVSRIEIKYELW